MQSFQIKKPVHQRCPVNFSYASIIWIRFEGMFSAHGSTPDERIEFVYPDIMSNLYLEIYLNEFLHKRRFISYCSFKKLKKSKLFLGNIMKQANNFVQLLIRKIEENLF